MGKTRLRLLWPTRARTRPIWAFFVYIHFQVGGVGGHAHAAPESGAVRLRRKNALLSVHESWTRLIWQGHGLLCNPPKAQPKRDQYVWGRSAAKAKLRAIRNTPNAEQYQERHKPANRRTQRETAQVPQCPHAMCSCSVRSRCLPLQLKECKCVALAPCTGALPRQYSALVVATSTS